MILIPSTTSGLTSSGSATAGMVTSSADPGNTRSLLLDRRTVDLDEALGDQVGGPGAGQPEQLRDRGVDPLAGQRLGDGEAAVVAAGHGSGSASAASRRSSAGSSDLARVPSSRMPRNAWTRISPAADVDAHVGDVEDRPVRQHQEVDDVAAERAGLAEQPVGQVAGHAGQQQRRARPPTARLPSRRLSQSTTPTADDRHAR